MYRFQHLSRYGTGLFMALLWSSVLGAQQPGSQRHFRVDDLFELESTSRFYGGPYAFSADGQRLAFTRVRPKKTWANFQQHLRLNAGADVWVQLDPAAEPSNVTNGEKDGSAWWSPQWSPDGRMLAMLSTRGGDVCLWVWDSATKQVRRLTTRNVELAKDAKERPYLWVDNRRILVPVMAEGEKPVDLIEKTQTPMIASAAWPRAQSGDAVTASVLQSGVPVDLMKRPQGDLLLVDAIDGTHKIVVRGLSQRWQLSPNRAAVASTVLHSQIGRAHV